MTIVEFLINKLDKLEMEKHLYKVVDYRIKKQKIIDEAKQMEDYIKNKIDDLENQILEMNERN